MTLATNGARQNGRWKYGAVNETAPNSADSQNWTGLMARAGLVLDHCADLLPKVAVGTLALDSAYNEASDKKRQQEQYGAVDATQPENTESRKSTWSDAMRSAGLVFHHCPDLLPKVAGDVL